MTKKKIIFSARDVGAAHNICAILKGFMERGFAREQLCVIASSVSEAVFTGQAIQPDHIIDIVEDIGLYGAGSALHQKCLTLLDSFGPDALLYGLSGHKAIGFDEAFAMIAKERKLVTYNYQDYWGEFHNSRSVYPDHVFVMDEAAQRLSHKFHEDQCALMHFHHVGAPKYSNYKNLDVAAIRQTTRSILSQYADVDAKPVLSWLGQNLGEYQGYWTTLRDFLNGFKACTPPGHTLFYRPHPLEDGDKAKQTLSFIEDHGVRAVIPQNLQCEDLLAACDISASCFSNSSLDHAYLNQFSGQPCGVPLLLPYAPDLMAVTPLLNENPLPVTALGLAYEAREGKDVSALMVEVLKPENALQYWKNCKNYPCPAQGIDRVFDVVMS